MHWHTTYSVTVTRRVTACKMCTPSYGSQADDETLETLLDHNTENQIDAASDLNAVLQMIEKLPPDQQLVLRLRTIDGLEIEQIQELTHFSRENIYTLLSRARKSLKELTAKL